MPLRTKSNARARPPISCCATLRGRRLLTVGFDDFRSGRQPDLVVRRDVSERTVENSDPMRHAHQERMKGDAHDARIALSFFIQDVECLADSPVELFDIDTRHIE